MVGNLAAAIVAARIVAPLDKIHFTSERPHSDFAGLDYREVTTRGGASFRPLRFTPGSARIRDFPKNHK